MDQQPGAVTPSRLRLGLDQGYGRDLQAKERGNEGEKLDARQLRELVRPLERSTDTARRAVEVGERKGHGPGHGELEAPNGRSWQWLRQRVGGLVASRAVHEPDGALVNHLVAKAVVARVDVSGLSVNLPQASRVFLRIGLPAAPAAVLKAI